MKNFSSTCCYRTKLYEIPSQIAVMVLRLEQSYFDCSRCRNPGEIEAAEPTEEAYSGIDIDAAGAVKTMEEAGEAAGLDIGAGDSEKTVDKAAEAAGAAIELAGAE